MSLARESRPDKPGHAAHVKRWILISKQASCVLPKNCSSWRSGPGWQRSCPMSMFHLGDEPVTDRLNVAKELRVLRTDPLGVLLELLDDPEGELLHHAPGGYLQAFDFYARSAERCLRNISTGTRYHRQVEPHLGGARSLSAGQRRLSQDFTARSPFFRVDMFNLLMHSRILLDKTIAFSRRILVGQRLPSFTSFAEHKKFFQRYPDAFSPRHRAYAQHLIAATAWFDMPLKVVRDKFGVHAGPPHFQFVTYPSEHDMGVFFVLDRGRPWPEYPEISTVRITARRMMHNVRQFLSWYSAYLVEALEGERGRGATASNIARTGGLASFPPVKRRSVRRTGLREGQK